MLNRALAIGVAASLALGSAILAQDANVPAQPHVWKNVQMVGGGFVPGIVFHPTAKGVAYARTDMGGGYRLNPDTGEWIPLTDFFRDYVEMGIESIACDPQVPGRVYFISGTTTADWAPASTILRSDNFGDTWERFPLPFKAGGNDDGRSIGERLAVDPHDGNILLFGTRKNGLWRSANRGETWEKVTTFPAEDVISRGAGIGIVLFDARSGQSGSATPTLYVAVSAPGVTNLYRSIDAGKTWAAIEGQPTGLIPHHMDIAKDGTLYVTYGNAIGPNGLSNGAVWKMNTATGEWTDVTPVKPGQAGQPTCGYAGLALDASDPNTLVVSSLNRWAGGDELWRSTDRGHSWTPFSTGAPRDASAAPYVGEHDSGHWVGDVDIDPFDSNHLMYVTGSGIWRTRGLQKVSKDQKPLFTVGAVGLEETAVLDIISLPEGPHLISGMRDLGGFTHDDLTRSPKDLFQNPRVREVTSLDFAALKPDLIVRTGSRAWSNQGAFAAISTDAGATWTPMAEPDKGRGGESIAISADGSSIVMVASGAGTLHSRDNGATWMAANGLPDNANWVVSDRVTPNHFYALARESNALFTSSDGGATFSEAPQLPGRGKLETAPGNAGHLWLPAGDKGLFRSTDGGKTFAPVAPATRADTVGFGKAADGQTYPAIFITGQTGSAYGIFRSDDEGKSWVRINDDQHQFGNLVFATTGDPRVFGRVYVATNGRGVVYAEPSK